KVRLTHLERPVVGGFRTYFCCPGCGRHCDLLYLCPNLACRRCHRLAFASENETPVSRDLRRLLKNRQRLGQSEGGVVMPFPSKPKWWRWARYLRTRKRCVREEREYWHALGIALFGDKLLRSKQTGQG